MRNVLLRFNSLPLMVAVLALGACGGGASNSTIPAWGSGAATAVTAESKSCIGAVKELFVAMQGTYAGVVDTRFQAIATLPLKEGVVYPVTIAAQDCSLRFTGEKDKIFSFTYGDTAGLTVGSLTGFSASEIIKSPTSLDLVGTQYNLSLASAETTIELERSVQRAGSMMGVQTGDLHVMALPGPASFGGLYLKVSTRY